MRTLVPTLWDHSYNMFSALPGSELALLLLLVMMAVTTTVLGNLLGAKDIKIKDIILPSRSWRLCKEVGIKKKKKNPNIKIQCNACVVGFLNREGACQWYIVVRLNLCRLRQKKQLGIVEPLHPHWIRGQVSSSHCLSRNQEIACDFNLFFFNGR